MTNKTTLLTDGRSVTSWYSKQDRLWITQLLDSHANQIGSASFTFGKASAKYDHSMMVNDAKRSLEYIP